MGTPLPPNESAPRCLDVFGPDKPFGDVPAPLVIQARFSNFQPDQAWDPDDEQLLLTPQLLEQQPNPCQYEITIADIQWFLWFRAASTIFSILEAITPKQYFVGDIATPGALIIFNEGTTGPNVATIGGEINLSWNQEDLT